MTILQKIYRKIGRGFLRLSGDPLLTPLEELPDAPDYIRYYRSFVGKPGLSRRPGGWEYEGRFYPDLIMVGGASHFIGRTAQRYCQGRGIDVGAGLWPLPGAMAVDVWRGPGAARKISDFASRSLDYVFSSHCLEHVTDWRPELMRWVNLLRPGGTIFLYLPHPDCGVWRPGSPMVGDGHKWQPTPAVIKQALHEQRCEVIEADDGPDAIMSFFVCARKTAT